MKNADTFAWSYSHLLQTTVRTNYVHQQQQQQLSDQRSDPFCYEAFASFFCNLVRQFVTVLSWIS